MARSEKRESGMPSLGGLVERLRALVRPGRPSAAASGKARGSASLGVAPRDAGWAELVTADGQTRMGRGLLLIWPTDSTRPSLGDKSSAGAAPARVGKDSALAVGDRAPHLRGELRSFRVDAGPPVRGDSLAVRPENETGMYPVVVQSFDDRDGQPVVHLDWSDERLPAAIRELGGE
ncbi:MAG: hypothetical protein M0R73_13665 [Dehalococcoidia bacterium]|nr:hypothetical protein [Dehalococcoidia bacterium]